jgi:hypothetical protein
MKERRQDMKTKTGVWMIRVFILVAVLAPVLGMAGAAWAAAPTKPNMDLQDES